MRPLRSTPCRNQVLDGKNRRLRIPGLLLAGLLGPLGAGCESQPPPPDPGRVTLRRLSRTEYGNTVRDLLGTRLRPAEELPPDDTGHGFDNLADVLTLSPLHLLRYERAAGQLLDEALRKSGRSVERTLPAEEMDLKVGLVRQRGAMFILSNLDVPLPLQVPEAGEYEITARAFGQQVPPDPARASVLVDGEVVRSFDVTAVEDAPQELRVTARISKGAHVISVAFTNDLYLDDPKDPTKKLDRNLGLLWIRVSGPITAPEKNPLRARLLPCELDGVSAESGLACARESLRRFVRRAFRRPPTAAELAELERFFEQARAEGDPIEAGLRLALTAALLSPHFLFRVELDAEPTSLVPHRLGDFELATRLSYFLWSSTPDDELLALAEAGVLQRDEVLKKQVGRMLADPRAESLLDSFAAQWLALRALDTAAPDPVRYPAFSEPLRAALREETRRYLREFFPLVGSRELGLRELPSAPFTFVDRDLARYYGLTSPGSAGGFEQVALEATPRRGLLTQGSVLLMTSYPDRTSPVRRGKWVLEQLLCAPPPPPPPDVIGSFGEGRGKGTLRQRLEEHRSRPECAGCHRLMDPIGFAFERFDAIGRLRGTDSGMAIDDSGELPDGQRFAGAAELSGVLSRDPRFVRCTVEKLMTYALGRAPEPAVDAQRLEALYAALEPEGSTLRTLIERLVLDEAFRSRRGEPQAPEASREGGAP
jgi:hypothetical protein